MSDSLRLSSNQAGVNPADESKHAAPTLQAEKVQSVLTGSTPTPNAVGEFYYLMPVDEDDTGNMVDIQSMTLETTNNAESEPVAENNSSRQLDISSLISSVADIPNEDDVYNKAVKILRSTEGNCHINIKIGDKNFLIVKDSDGIEKIDLKSKLPDNLQEKAETILFQEAIDAMEKQAGDCKLHIDIGDKKYEVRKENGAITFEETSDTTSSSPSATALDSAINEAKKSLMSTQKNTYMNIEIGDQKILLIKENDQIIAHNVSSGTAEDLIHKISSPGFILVHKNETKPADSTTEQTYSAPKGVSKKRRAAQIGLAVAATGVALGGISLPVLAIPAFLTAGGLAYAAHRAGRARTADQLGATKPMPQNHSSLKATAIKLTTAVAEAIRSYTARGNEATAATATPTRANQASQTLNASNQVHSQAPETLSQKIKTMTADKIGMLSIEQIKELSDGALYALKAEQRAAFTKEQLLALSDIQYNGFKNGPQPVTDCPAKIFVEMRAKSRDDVRALTIESLSIDQLQFLSTEQINFLTADQVRAMSQAQITAMSTLQIFALNDDAFSALLQSENLPNTFEPVEYRKSMKTIISSGETEIVLSGNNKDGRAGLNIPDEPGTRATIKFSNDVKIVYNMNFQEMDSNVPAACLVMSKKDFEMLRSVVHTSAFSTDFLELNEDTVLLWKYPADLNQIAGLSITETKVTVACGTYPIIDDANPTQVEVASMTKIRTDFHDKSSNTPLPSTHILVGPDKQELPAFATGNLFKDFNNPTVEENQLASQMLARLKELGIKAFTCGNQHHLFVFEKDNEGNTLTPQKFAEKLQGPDGKKIIEALKAGTTDKEKQAKIDQWAQAFISQYSDTKQKNAEEQ